jgi:hypothetical protein
MTRLLRRSVYAALAVIPALGMLLGLGATANASASPAASASASPAATARAEAIALIKSLKIGFHGTDQRAGTAHHQIFGLTQVQSTNWAGYADTGSSFSRVSASWTEPSVSCSRSQTQLAAFWVGIDGFSSSSVEQDGTLIECVRGVASQFTWWEIFPVNSVQVVGSSLASGDAITSTVTRSGTSYTMTVTDSTHPANSFTTTQTFAGGANSSAEWIAEAPSGSGGIFPLANFHTWNAANASVTQGSTSGVISSFTDDEITMVNSSGAVKAQPGALNSAGNGFPVTFVRST